MYTQTEVIKDTTANGPEGELVINVGPQHPATHGVLHLVITLNGETIKKIEPHLGYIHSCHQIAKLTPICHMFQCRKIRKSG